MGNNNTRGPTVLQKSLARLRYPVQALTAVVFCLVGSVAVPQVDTDDLDAVEKRLIEHYSMREVPDSVDYVGLAHELNGLAAVP